MKKDLSSFKNSPLLSGLDETEIDRLLSKLSVVELKPGEILFEQDAPSDSMYFLVSGTLSGQLISANAQQTKIVGKVLPGESVGEMGLITDQPRTLTIIAVKHSRLLKLTKEQLTEFLQRQPNAISALLKATIKRSQRTIEVFADKKLNRNILISTLNSSVDVSLLFKKLNTALKKNLQAILLTDRDILECANQYQLDLKINELEKNYQNIIYFIQQHDLLDKLSDHCNEIYMVTHENADKSIEPHLLKIFDLKKINYNITVQLIILHEEYQHIYSGTLAWLQLGNYQLHHHIALNQTADFERLLRFIMGRANGLVLSGGGTRCWVEVGALRAIYEQQIPIDAVGGTSLGATLAAFKIFSENFSIFSEFADRTFDTIHRSISFSQMTWPLIAFFSGEFCTKAVVENFKDYQIEDLSIPFYAVSVNLNTLTEKIHRQGSLWRALRASFTIPGLVPPITEGGDLFIDGGILNNCPVDVMRDLLGREANIIAVDVSAVDVNPEQYFCEPVVGWRKILKYYFNKKSENRLKPPRAMEYAINSMFVGAANRARENRTLANIVISPKLKSVSLISKKFKQEKITAGYECATEKLKDWDN